MVAGSVLAGFALLAIVAALIPRDRYTGTNSVGVRSVVADLEPGQRLCVPKLDVPDGTGRVRVHAFWQGERRPAFDVRLTAEDHIRSGRLDAADSQTTVSGSPVDISLPSIDLDRESVPGTLCVTPSGAVAIGGMLDLQDDQAAPTVDGRDIAARVAVWFLPPRDEETSALSIAGDIISRAALFRPGVIGPWTYVLLLLAWPLLAYAAVRLLVRRPGVPRTALAVGLIAFATAASWALVTPPFGAPDEPDHFAYAQAFAESGKAPDRVLGSRGPYSSRATVALDAMRVYSQVELASARSPWLEVAEERWRERVRTEKLSSDDGGGFLASTSTHAPLYYALTLPGYALAGPDNPFAALTAMRLISALLGALTAVCAFLTVRELAPRHEMLAVAAGLVVAFQPMFAFISGALNNDNGVNAAAAFVIFLLIRGLRRGMSVPMGLGIAAGLMVLPLMKGTGYALYPAALVALAGMLWRRHSKSDLPGYAALAAAFVGFNVVWASVSDSFGRTAFTTPGGVSPTASNGIVGGVLSDPALYLSYLWQVFLPRLPFMSNLHGQQVPAFDIYIERGWAAFGWYAIKFPHWVYLGVTLAVLAGFALCLKTLVRERDAVRTRGWELAVLALVIVGVIGGVEAAYVTSDPRQVVAEQGRYAFTALVPLAAVAAGACLGLGRRRAPLVAGALVAAMAGFGFLSLLLGFEGFYA